METKVESASNSRQSIQTALKGLVRVIDRDWRPSRFDYGVGNWLFYLQCGHVEWRKGSKGLPRRVKCAACARGSAVKDPEWLAKYPEKALEEGWVGWAQ